MVDGAVLGIVQEVLGWCDRENPQVLLFGKNTGESSVVLLLLYLGTVLEKVEQYNYLERVLDCEAGIETRTREVATQAG